MSKYLLLKHYRGAPASINDVPMDQRTPEEVSAHMQNMRDFAARLRYRQVRRRSGALPGGHVRPLRRRGAAAGHRGPVRGDQGPGRTAQYLKRLGQSQYGAPGPT
jgi:hypothetical protein